MLRSRIAAAQRGRIECSTWNTPGINGGVPCEGSGAGCAATRRAVRPPPAQQRERRRRLLAWASKQSSRPPGLRNAWVARAASRSEPDGAHGDQIEASWTVASDRSSSNRRSPRDAGRAQLPHRLAEKGATCGSSTRPCTATRPGAAIRSGIAGEPPPEPMSSIRAAPPRIARPASGSRSAGPRLRRDRRSAVRFIRAFQALKSASTLRARSSSRQVQIDARARLAITRLRQSRRPAGELDRMPAGACQRTSTLPAARDDGARARCTAAAAGVTPGDPRGLA